MPDCLGRCRWTVFGYFLSILFLTFIHGPSVAAQTQNTLLLPDDFVFFSVGKISVAGVASDGSTTFIYEDIHVADTFTATATHTIVADLKNYIETQPEGGVAPIVETCSYIQNGLAADCGEFQNIGGSLSLRGSFTVTKIQTKLYAAPVTAIPSGPGISSLVLSSLPVPSSLTDLTSTPLRTSSASISQPVASAPAVFSSNSNKSAIIGAVVGSVIGVLVLIILLLYLARRRRLRLLLIQKAKRMSITATELGEQNPYPINYPSAFNPIEKTVIATHYSPVASGKPSKTLQNPSAEGATSHTNLLSTSSPPAPSGSNTFLVEEVRRMREDLALLRNQMDQGSRDDMRSISGSEAPPTYVA